jgi:DNA (cytosine-5)-methyltransferase 1
MKFIELFAGIGAFRLGLERTGHECVWANEWLEKPRRIYERNFGEQPDARDIRDVRPEDLPEADLIVGGFPCATFSVAGKRTGFSLEDTRGTLAFEMFRLAKDKQIPYILFENVKGLLNHDSGRTFEIILGVLDELGYDCQWELLDSQNFGVPQHRERIFLIANLRGKPRPKVFPIGQTGEPIVRKGRVTQTEEKEIEVSQWRRGFFRKYKSDGVPTLTANMGTGGHNVPFVTGREPKETDVFPTIDGHYWKGIQNNQGRGAVKSVKPIMDVQRFNKSPNGRMIKDDDESMYTITAQDRHGVIIEKEVETIEGFHVTDDPMLWDIYNKRTRAVSPTLTTPNHNSIRLSVEQRIRKLTPLECERLQGFPDGWTEFYPDGTKVSDSERYERCGRTITIPVVEAIGRRLHEFW